MTVVVAVEAVVLAVLLVLVAGLLRAYGTVLRRLHQLDPGDGRAPEFAVGTPPSRVVESRGDWTAAHDVSGETTDGEIVSVRVVGCEHDSVLVFLSSGCSTCATFWTELAHRSVATDELRVLIVTQGPAEESRDAVAALAPPDVEVVMSTQAWQDYEVPGSPYVVYVDGTTGRVRGEGTGQSWAQVRDMVDRAGVAPRDKSRRDADQELEVDRALLAAGILPGDPRLYGSDTGPAA